MNRRADILRKNLDAFAIMALMLCIFGYIMFLGYSDLVAHAEGAQGKLQNKSLFSDNFLMYFMANLLSGFSGNLFSIKLSLVFLISVSNTAKYCIVKKAFRQWCDKGKAKLAAASLLFVYIIPVLYFLKVFGIYRNAITLYSGYYVPNVWHNSTILCMMPFAILTYLLAVKQFGSFDVKRNRFISLFTAIGVLVKPSFFFVFAVAYPVVMFCAYRFKKEFFRSLIPIVCGALCVFYEYCSIYTWNEMDDNGIAISIAPLFTLAFWKSHWLYLSVSLAFPFLFVCCFWRRVKHDKEFWFVFVMLVVALGIKWCCKETGSRSNDGNFGWQVIAAMWFVFYYILKTMVKTWKENEPSVVLCNERCNILKINKLAVLRGGVILYALHVLMGLAYLLRFLITNRYY